VFRAGQLYHPRSLANTSPGEVADQIAEHTSAQELGIIVICSVNDQFAASLESTLSTTALAAVSVVWVGRDLAIPMLHTLDDPSTVGHDRLLNALGAFSRTRQACVVVDCGTAVTIDFIDGQGTFHGGAILPGVQMMLDALHQRTAALPEVRFAGPPPAEPFCGKDTRSAMVLGVAASVVGGVHRLVQRYSEAFGAYPQVVATGGDAPALLEHDDVVEHIVPDLQLLGISEVYAHARRADADDEPALDEL